MVAGAATSGGFWDEECDWKRNAPDAFRARDATRALLRDGERGVRKLLRMENEHGQEVEERD